MRDSRNDEIVGVDPIG